MVAVTSVTISKTDLNSFIMENDAASLKNVVFNEILTWQYHTANDKIREEHKYWCPYEDKNNNVC